MAVSRQVVILYAATQKLLADVPVEKGPWWQGLADEDDRRYPDVMKSIDDTENSPPKGRGHPGVLRDL